MTLQKYMPLIILITIAASGYTQTKKTTAQKPAVTPKPAAKPKPDIGNSLLWEISGNGLGEPSYLYGTMHMVCAGDAVISGDLKNVIKAVKQVFFEVDIDDMGELMGMLKYARMTNERKITDLLTPVEYQRLTAYFAKNPSPLPLTMMERFKPYFITAMISEGLMPCEEKVSMEELIMQEAKQYDKDISGLESMEFQASLFDSIPYEKQAQDLVKYIDSVDTYRQRMKELVELYRKQDIRNMDSLVTQSDPAMAEYMDMLLYDRNRRWTSQILEQAFEKQTLFAVGAGHLGGSKGVISLLREKGFTVKPLPNRSMVISRQSS